MGSFGGTYYRNIYSRVTKVTHTNMWQELPSEWLEGLNVKTHVASQVYNKALNKYKADCGGDLDMWEGSGWITAIDPYGWFQWYCRFYQGRRSSDDERSLHNDSSIIYYRNYYLYLYLSSTSAGKLGAETE